MDSLSKDEDKNRHNGIDNNQIEEERNRCQQEVNELSAKQTIHKKTKREIIREEIDRKLKEHEEIAKLNKKEEDQSVRWLEELIAELSKTKEQNSFNVERIIENKKHKKTKEKICRNKESGILKDNKNQGQTPNCEVAVYNDDIRYQQELRKQLNREIKKLPKSKRCEIESALESMDIYIEQLEREERNDDAGYLKYMYSETTYEHDNSEWYYSDDDIDWESADYGYRYWNGDDDGYLDSLTEKDK